MSLSPAAVLAGGVLLSILVVGMWLLLRPKIAPEELERRRRHYIHLHGRIRDAEVTEVRDWVAYYTYLVAGVTYTASQDMSTLREFLPEDPTLLAGSAGVKYLGRNPADSIVICEDWSGLRIPPEYGKTSHEAGESVPRHGVGQA